MQTRSPATPKSKRSKNTGTPAQAQRESPGNKGGIADPIDDSDDEWKLLAEADEQRQKELRAKKLAEEALQQQTRAAQALLEEDKIKK